MVTCTTPPFRAAVRLNSGVRLLQAKVIGTRHEPVAFLADLGRANDRSSACEAPLRRASPNQHRRLRPDHMARLLRTRAGNVHRIVVWSLRCGPPAGATRQQALARTPAGYMICPHRRIPDYTRRRCWVALAHGWQQPNNSFKPTPLRSGKTVAERACHCFASTKLRGLTQALGGHGHIKARTD